MLRNGRHGVFCAANSERESQETLNRNKNILLVNIFLCIVHSTFVKNTGYIRENVKFAKVACNSRATML